MHAMSRRLVLAQLGGLGACSLLVAAPPRAARADPLGIPVGIQLWTVNDALQADPVATLESLRRIGYRNVETAGFGTRTAREFRGLLDAAGLVCPSAHLDFLKGDPGVQFDAAHALGARYAVSSILRIGTGPTPKVDPSMEKFAGSMNAMTLDDARKTAEIANRLGAQAKRAGLRFAYHNHFFEFVPMEGGEVAYAVLLRETDPDLVHFEIDCGWMMAAGHDPVSYLRKYPHRFPMLHIKDFLPVPGGVETGPAMRIGTELGHGFIDYRPVFAAAKTAGLEYYFVEQEAPFTHMTPLEAAKVDYAYLKSIRD